MRVSFRLSGKVRGKGRPRLRIIRTESPDPSKERVFGSAYTPAQTRHYEAALTFAAQQAMGHTKPFEGAVRLLFIAVFEIPKSWPKGKRAAALAGKIRPAVTPDWDNIGKLADALNGVVFLDDKQVVSGTVEKWYGPAPELEAIITELSGGKTLCDGYGQPAQFDAACP
jgi:Holliday junction resolvase RusA-like endonuclease